MSQRGRGKKGKTVSSTLRDSQQLDEFSEDSQPLISPSELKQICRKSPRKAKPIMDLSPIKRKRGGKASDDKEPPAKYSKKVRFSK